MTGSRRSRVGRFFPLAICFLPPLLMTQNGGQCDAIPHSPMLQRKCGRPKRGSATPCSLTVLHQIRDIALRPGKFQVRPLIDRLNWPAVGTV